MCKGIWLDFIQKRNFSTSVRGFPVSNIFLFVSSFKKPVSSYETCSLVAMMKLWGLQHRPFPHGLTKTVPWQLPFVTFSQISWIELWDSVLSYPVRWLFCHQDQIFLVLFLAYLSSKLSAGSTAVSLLTVPCPVCVFIISALVSLPDQLTAPAAPPKCVTRSLRLVPVFAPAFLPLLSFHSRLNILLLHVLQKVSFLPLIYFVLPFWVVPFPLRFCLLKRMKWNYHA